MYNNGLNLLEIENDILEDYKGDFELNEPLFYGETEQKNKCWI